jgi:hypothetical protein
MNVILTLSDVIEGESMASCARNIEGRGSVLMTGELNATVIEKSSTY